MASSRTHQLQQTLSGRLRNAMTLEVVYVCYSNCEYLGFWLILMLCMQVSHCLGMRSVGLSTYQQGYTWQLTTITQLVMLLIMIYIQLKWEMFKFNHPPPRCSPMVTMETFDFGVFLW